MQKFWQSLKVEPENYGLLKRIYFALFTSGLMAVMLGTLLPYIRDESGLNYSQSGLLFSAHQLGNLCAVLVVGFLSHTIGRKKSTLLMGAGTTIGLILIPFVKSPWLLLTAFAFTGMGRGTMSNTCNVVAADISGNRAAALNVLHAVFAIGALLSPVIVYSFTAVSVVGWKLAALTAAALAATAWVLLSRSKLSNVPDKKEKDGALSFLKSLSFWICTMILFCYICAEASIMGWFVIYFEDTGVLSSGMAGLTPILLWVMMLIGRLSCAAVSTRIDKNKLLLALSIAFSVSFAAMIFSRSTVACVISLLGIGLSMAGIYPTTLSTMKGSLSPVSTGFAMAIASAGGILMPGIVGAVADAYGLAGGVSMILVALIAMVILILFNIFTAGRGVKETVQ